MENTELLLEDTHVLANREGRTQTPYIGKVRHQSALTVFVCRYNEPKPREALQTVLLTTHHQETRQQPGLTLFVSGNWPAVACHLLYNNPEPTLSCISFRFPEYNICCALCCQFTVLSIIYRKASPSGSLTRIRCKEASNGKIFSKGGFSDR